LSILHGGSEGFRKSQEKTFNGMKKGMVFTTGDKPAIRFWQYLVAVIVPILFVAPPLFFLIRNLDRQLVQTRSEIEGVAVLGSIHEGMTILQRSRGLSEIAQFKGPVFAAELARLHRRFLEVLSELQSRYSDPGFNLAPAVARLKEQADLLFQGDPEGSLEIAEAHTRLIREMLQLSRMVSVTSRLSLDPGEESYFLIDIMTNQLPDLMETVGRLRARGSRLLAAGEWGRRQEILLREHLAILLSHLERLEDKLALAGVIEPPVSAIVLAVKDNADLGRFVTLNEQIIRGLAPLPDVEEYFDAGSAAIEGYYEPLARIRIALTDLLTERQDRLEWLKALALLGTMAAVLLLLAFNTAFYRRNRTAFRRIEELAVTDMLTGLYNRRFMGLVIDQELQRAKREGKSFTLVVLDIDYFKLYNDLLGHQAGDEVLRLVAAGMKSCLQRPGDFLFRIGGEEFCFFLAGQDPEDAEAMAEKVRRTVEELNIGHPGSKVSPVVTISAGGVHLPVVTSATFDPIMKMADDALYEAKKAGRNRCRFHVPGGRKGQRGE
jgi:diguanylate cyclase (GGDEF)-like protein